MLELHFTKILSFNNKAVGTNEAEHATSDSKRGEAVVRVNDDNARNTVVMVERLFIQEATMGAGDCMSRKLLRQFTDSLRGAGNKPIALLENLKELIGVEMVVFVGSRRNGITLINSRRVLCDLLSGKSGNVLTGNGRNGGDVVHGFVFCLLVGYASNIV